MEQEARAGNPFLDVGVEAMSLQTGRMGRYGEQLAWTPSYLSSVCRCVLCVFYCDSSSTMQLTVPTTELFSQDQHQIAPAGAISNSFSAISFLPSFTSSKRWLSSFIILYFPLSSSFQSIKAPH